MLKLSIGRPVAYGNTRNQLKATEPEAIVIGHTSYGWIKIKFIRGTRVNVTTTVAPTSLIPFLTRTELLELLCSAAADTCKGFKRVETIELIMRMSTYVPE